MTTVIIFEGTDGSGKSTLKRKVDTATNYQYVCVDRFTGSTIVYDKATGRACRQQELLAIEDKLHKHAILVYCHATTDIIMERLAAKGDNISKKQIEEHKILYAEYINKTKMKYISVDTTANINTCVNKVLKKIKQLEEKMEFVDELIEETKKQIEALKDTEDKEIIAYKQCFDVNATKVLSEQDSSIKKVKKAVEKFGITDEINITYDKKMDIEEKYYSSIKHGLRHSLAEIKWLFGEKEMKKTRKAIYLSHDCISAVNISPRKNYTNLTIYLRSCNARWGLCMDVYYVTLAACEIIKEHSFNNKIKLTVFCSNLHILK